MPEEKPAEKTKKGCRPVSIVFGILGLILIAFVVWGFFRFYGPFGGSSPTATTSPSSQFTRTSPTPAKGGKVDSALVGTWVSDCLVPDPESPWSEKHQFVIKDDGTAVHTRWSNDKMDHNCIPNWEMGTIVNNFQFTIPQTGQINLSENGQTMYDIYQISGKDLMFGHGFQAHYPAGYDATQGQSEGHRFHDLNTYIVYHKQ